MHRRLQVKASSDFSPSAVKSYFEVVAANFLYSTTFLWFSKVCNFASQYCRETIFATMFIVKIPNQHNFGCLYQMFPSHIGSIPT